MFRCFLLASPRVITKSGALFAHPNKVVSSPLASRSTTNIVDNDIEVSCAKPTSPPDFSESSTTHIASAHILPQSVLKEVLQSVSAGQQTFLFGTSKDAADPNAGVLRATGSFFESINTAYEGRMLQEQQVEVENYVVKRRLHYTQRLNEETEEFRREQKEIHDEIQRLETEKYKNELNKDVAQFTKSREAEYEALLHTDVEKYHKALLAYHAGQKQSEKPANEVEEATKQLRMNVMETIEDMEVDETLRNFGSTAGFGNDITDQDIRNYVLQRTCFYEQSVQDEIRCFTKRRKSFYEDLLEARAVRHAAKIRTDTERFRRQRQIYYDERLTNDGSWMAKCFQEHYNRCFLQAYARRAWIDHRRYVATQEGINVTGDNGEKVPAIADPSDISVATLNAEIPLLEVLKTYENENMAEVTRDVFLKAARRVAIDFSSYQGNDQSSA